VPSVLPLAEWSLSTLSAMGFGTHDMLCAHISLFAHVRGMALARLTEAQAEKDTGMPADEWMRRHDRALRQQAGSAGHPGLARVIREPFTSTSTRSSSTGCSACSTALTPDAAPSGTGSLVPHPPDDQLIALTHRLRPRPVGVQPPHDMHVGALHRASQRGRAGHEVHVRTAQPGCLAAPQPGTGQHQRTRPALTWAAGCGRLVSLEPPARRTLPNLAWYRRARSRTACR
jgi:hypothetical protein